jgi:hypothetical protein
MNIVRWMGWALVAGICSSGGAVFAQGASVRDDAAGGGFGAPVLKFTDVDGRFGVLLGGRGGWIVDGSFVIGGGGYRLVNTGNFDHRANDGGDPGTLELTYGGLELGYLARAADRVDLTLGLLIGGGAAAWSPDDSSSSEIDDSFFVAEPEVGVAIGLSRAFRVGIGASYRIARGAELFDLGNGDLSGLGATLSFQFGRFQGPGRS